MERTHFTPAPEMDGKDWCIAVLVGLLIILGVTMSHQPDVQYTGGVEHHG